ncbi:R2-like ligand-binding oxidase [Dictyobacter aurantiacus]|uniref:R2-like ligand binding oxidase n=1 Tax=Dictyobacter aurantiacus TaxID=1936993 RepID=A0A401ZM99_9CHLR|nr:R2-like ligand-binding oxidase [Dictyobacter aurantiacus]GCE07999.1 ribonucleotide-diphosphate reductase [Dictyobacter aurantiacus]
MTAVPERTYTTLSSSGLRQDILPMRLYQKAKRLGIWDPRAIDLSRDRQDWLSLSDEKQEAVRRSVIAFQAGEEAVTLDLLPLIMTIARENRLEEEMFLTTFLWEEAKHTEFFRRVLDEVMQEHNDLHEGRRASGGRDIFADELPRTMNLLLTDPSPLNQARASVLYNMIVEGVLAETGYFSFARMLDEGNIMPGFRQGIALIKRDESRHIAYGVFLISRLVAEHPDLWPQVEARMNELFAAIARHQEQDGTPDVIRDYARQQFEKRLKRISRARTQSLEQVYHTLENEEAEAV